jgi:hypothetical protein
MAHLDDYLRAYATPRLGPGEEIIGFGMLFRRRGERQEGWLAAATNQRLMLMRAHVTVMGEAQPRLGETMEWRYDELQNVEVKTPPGALEKGLRLIPYPAHGPLASESAGYMADSSHPELYWMYREQKKLDDHARFMSGFPDWLMAQVRSGAFVTPEKQAAIQAKIAARGAETEAKRKATAEAAASAARKWGPRLLRVLIALPFLAVIGFNAVQLADEVPYYLEPIGDPDSETIDRAETDYEWAEDGYEPLPECKSSDYSARIKWCRHCAKWRDDRPPKKLDDEDDYTTFERADFTWVCKSPSELESELRDAEDWIEESREQDLADREEALGKIIEYGAIAGGALILGLILLIWDRIRARRRRDAQPQAQHNS